VPINPIIRTETIIMVTSTPLHVIYLVSEVGGSDRIGFFSSGYDRKIRDIVGKSEGQRPPRRSGRVWKYDDNVNLTQIKCEYTELDSSGPLFLGVGQLTPC
jgi:hypothetical protein